jgi:D-3-phosphoglycerate dehydrogenase
MKVIAADPFAKDATHSVDELVAEADVISMHAAVTPDSVGLMSAERFAAMKDGSIFVNSARAGLHDLDGLVAALQRGNVIGAGLDHFEGENIAVDHPLLSLPGVVVAPHIGGATYDTETNHTTLMADGLAALFRGERPANIVNPEVLSR